MKRKIMAIGLTGCGKTSLLNRLNGDRRKIKKTQDMIYGKNTIDVPGSYLENPWMYSHLISAAQNGAKHILFIISMDTEEKTFPPGFAKIFPYPVTGVITKCDLKTGKMDFCRRQLKVMGVEEPYFLVTMEEEESIRALKKHLNIE